MKRYITSGEAAPPVLYSATHNNVVLCLGALIRTGWSLKVCSFSCLTFTGKILNWNVADKNATLRNPCYTWGDFFSCKDQDFWPTMCLAALLKRVYVKNLQTCTTGNYRELLIYDIIYNDSIDIELLIQNTKKGRVKKATLRYSVPLGVTLYYQTHCRMLLQVMSSGEKMEIRKHYHTRREKPWLWRCMWLQSDVKSS